MAGILMSLHVQSEDSVEDPAEKRLLQTKGRGLRLLAPLSDLKSLELRENTILLLKPSNLWYLMTAWTH